jgi:hydroxylaminobenzene mutase
MLRHGLVVFLLGLVTGLVMTGPFDIFKNPRLALSSHLVGVTGGMFLVIAGLLVDRVRLAARLLAVTSWLALYGAYGNWIGTSLGAIFGTRTLTVVTAEGHSGTAWQEMTVGVVLITSGIATMVACVILLVGLRGPRGNKDS